MERYPLLLEVVLNIFRYFKYLIKSENVLLSEVSKSLKSLNINSWYGSIESLMQYFNIDAKKVKKMKINLKSLIYSKLEQKYNFDGDLKFMMTEIINRGVINQELTDYLKIIFP